MSELNRDDKIRNLFLKVFQEDGIIKAIKMMKNAHVSKEVIITQLVEYYSLSEKDATELVDLHWTS